MDSCCNFQDAAFSCVRSTIAFAYRSVHTMIFHHDDVPPHVAVPFKDYLENDGWELLPHPPITQTYFILITTCFHRCRISFLEYGSPMLKVLKNGLMTFLAQKMRCFFGMESIKCLKDGEKKVNASDGQYFE